MILERNIMDFANKFCGPKTIQAIREFCHLDFNEEKARVLAEIEQEVEKATARVSAEMNQDVEGSDAIEKMIKAKFALKFKRFWYDQMYLNDFQICFGKGN